MWASLDILEQEVGDAPGTAPAVEGCLAAVAEDVVDVLLDRDIAVAEEGRTRLSTILDGFVARHGLEIEDTAGFIAGQLAGVTEVLAAACGRHLPAAFARVWDNVADATEGSDKKYWPVIAALYEREMNTSTLAAQLKITGETASRKLTTLRESGIVISRKTGRLVYSRLNPAAKAHFAPSIEAERHENPVRNMRFLDFAHYSIEPAMSHRLQEMARAPEYLF